MIKACIKNVLVAFLLLYLNIQVVNAEVKVYQYDGKLPFVQMMLNMMVAMGILDRMPTNGLYGMSAYPSSPWSGRVNPYAANPYTSNPFTRSPWSLSPWSSPVNNQAGWGSPNWGVLPIDSYTTNNYSPWSTDDLNGWVNEPWEASAWNPDAAPDNAQPENSAADDGVKQASPLKKYANREQPSRQQQNKQRQNRQPKIRSRQKPCVTDFCGLKKPDLDGLWVAQNGEMLGIKNQRYLWGDSSERYLSGQIKIQNEYLLANVDGHDRLMRFKYKLAGNHLLTMQPDGKIREFTRLQPGQYNSGPYGQGQYNQGQYNQGQYNPGQYNPGQYNLGGQPYYR